MDLAFSRHAHVFVDESKASGYYIAAAVVAPADLASTRTTLRALRHKGATSVHFKSERDAVRHAFLTGAAKTGVKTLLYVTKGKPDKWARPACLAALVADLCQVGADRLVLEQDDSLIKADRQIINAAYRQHMGEPGSSYHPEDCQAYFLGLLPFAQLTLARRMCKSQRAWRTDGTSPKITCSVSWSY